MMNSVMKYYQKLSQLLRNRAAWKITLRIAAAFLLLSIIYYSAERYRGKKNYPDTRIQMSVFNSGSSGTMALREFLEKTGKKTGRILRPFVKFAEDSAHGNSPPSGSILIIDPDRDLSEGDITTLRRLAEHGTSVFIFARQESLFRHLFSYDASWRKKALSSGEALRSIPQPRTDSLRFTIRGMEGIQALDLPGRWRFKTVPGHWHPLARDSQGTIALYRRAGKGQFIAVSGALFLSNADIRKRDNGLFAHTLISRFHKHGTIYFDEYLHGFSTRYTLFYFFARSEYRNIIVHTVLFFLLCAIPAGIRFGQYRKKPAAPQEKIYYFSEGMAGLLRKHRHYSGILEMMTDNYRKYSILKPEPRSGEKLKQLQVIRERKKGTRRGKSDIRTAYTIIKGE